MTTRDEEYRQAQDRIECLYCGELVNKSDTIIVTEDKKIVDWICKICNGDAKMETNKTIFNTDGMFKMIQEMKELRKLITPDTKERIMKRYRLKVQAEFLDTLLQEGGFDNFMKKILTKKEQIRLNNAVREEDEDAE